MFRYDIINQLIQKNKYKRYLEIGTQSDKCLYLVNCEYKVGVDPDPVVHFDNNSNEFYKMTSDEFFKQNKSKFDVIFVDGLHTESQVKRDIQNSLQCLSAGGSIVVHDCNPQEEINQQVPMPHVASWNGTVWRAWIWFRHIATLEMVVIDADEGCGVIQRGWQTTLNEKYNITFEEFSKDRKYLLNLISEEEWKGRIGV